MGETTRPLEEFEQPGPSQQKSFTARPRGSTKDVTFNSKDLDTKSTLLLVALLRDHFFFHYLTNLQMELLLSELDYFLCSEEEFLYRQDSKPNGMFILDSGLCGAQSECKKLERKILPYKKIFGEIGKQICC